MSHFPNPAGFTLSQGGRLGKYQIVRLLGAGGMGAVYEAIHVEIGKAVALKVLNPSIAVIPGARGRFLREAQLTARIYHPNIVDVTDTGSEGEHTFLVMELFRGEDLAQRIARQGRLATTECVDIMLPVCSAVMAAHEAGVTHRDLKPSNIFLAEGQRGIDPKILDFGISKSIDTAVGPEALTNTGAVVGTPFYLAPEQVTDNRSAGPASDQYALGVIAYECLTGFRPFQNESLYVVFRDIVAGAAPPPSSRCPDLPRGLEQIIQKAMHVLAKERFGSAGDLGRALLPFASNRVRSIWEDSFNPKDRLASDLSQPASSPGRSVAATRVLTPSVTPSVPVTATPSASGPVGRAGGTQVVNAVSDSWLRKNQEAVPPSMSASMAGTAMGDDPAVGPATYLRPSRAWLPWTIGIALVVAAGSALLAVGGSAGRSPSALTESKHKPKKVLDLPDLPGGAAPPAAEAVAGGKTDPEMFEVSLTVEPQSALIELDGRVVGRGRLQRAMAKDHTLHRLQIAAPGYEPEVVEFSDTPPPKQIALTASRVPAPERGAANRSSRGRRRDDEGRSRDRSQNQAQPAESGTEPPHRSLNPNGAPIID